MKIVIWLISVFILLGVIITGAIFYEYSSYRKDIPSPGFDRKIIEIKKGYSFAKVAELLKEEGLISSTLKFSLYAKLKKADRNIKTGEIEFQAPFTPDSILDALVKGKVRSYKLTIPEGASINEIAELVEEIFSIPKETFLKKVADKKFQTELNFTRNSFEGYLFPDTYYFEKNVDSGLIIRTLFQHFKDIFSEKLRNRAKELSMSIHDVVILASIIEKETGVPNERAKISSVFHNRLKKNMRLQSDPTVIYGMKNYQGNITKEDLLTYSPYNTYRINGLPQGPIANPGYDAIYATLFPEDTNFLYFVANKKGEHIFSSNYEDHLKAVNLYQKNLRVKEFQSEVSEED